MTARVTRMWDPNGNEVKIVPQTRILYEKFPGINMKKKYPQKKRPAKKCNKQN
jgi:hypothetical protein